MILNLKLILNILFINLVFISAKSIPDKMHTPAHYGHHHHHRVARAEIVPNWNKHDLYHEIRYNLDKREEPLPVRQMRFSNFWGDGFVPF